MRQPPPHPDPLPPKGGEGDFAGAAVGLQECGSGAGASPAFAGAGSSRRPLSRPPQDEGCGKRGRNAAIPASRSAAPLGHRRADRRCGEPALLAEMPSAAATGRAPGPQRQIGQNWPHFSHIYARFQNLCNAHSSLRLSLKRCTLVLLPLFQKNTWSEMCQYVTHLAKLLIKSYSWLMNCGDQH